MTCEQAVLRMAELLAGEIPPEDRSRLEKHLLDCATCRGDFELARAGARIEWADVSVPKEVIEATLASFRQPAPVVRLLRWATAAAALFGLAALLIASSRAPKAEETKVACGFERPQMLATMQDPAVGAMVCKDEDGRPVGELGLKSHEVSVEILDGIAKTTVEENFENHTSRRLEGTFHFPLPSDASISRLALEVNGKIEEGTCLERERAREVFEGIVRRMQDPALLEWQPGGLFKCRVFPIEPRSTKRVIVAYTQALPCFQGKMTYVYPLASEKTRTHAPEEVRIGVQARFSGALAKIESPSHHLEVQRRNANEAAMSFRAAHYRPNNDFVVTMEPGPEEVRVVSHKTDGEDGYFACFATPQGGGERQPAKYAFVLDASASINAPRLEVAKRLVRAMMERRIEGDRFEILAHHIEVERSGDVDLRAANTFMDRLKPIGGSDVLQALQAPAGDAEIIYIGKGAPTFGETEPSKILEAVKGRRIRTIAVGSDANVGLLERLGGMMRVNPNDDVAKRVAEIAATIGSPVLSDVKLEGGDAVYDVVGVRDLFYGERLIVSGRYRGPTAKLAISGRGYRREVDVAFPAKDEGNNYVRRLWAQRKVADLLAKGPATKAEVTDLGVKYQIMTPYTSFLVLETEQMWKDHQLKREVQKQDEVLGKRGEEGRDDFRVRIDQAQVEITKHVRDGERYRNARMFDQAAKEFENAEFKILNIPYDVKAMKELLPFVQDSIVKSRNEGILEERRTEDEKKRLSEAEAKAHDPVRSDREWEELMSKLKAQQGVSEQQKAAIADEQYRLAERCFQAGDFEKSVVAAQKALQANPNHAASRALFVENQFILGKGKATPTTSEYDKFMQEALVRNQQVNIEVDAARERARLADRNGDRAQAEREYRKIIEFSKWMPAGAELETRRREAEELLSRTRTLDPRPPAPSPVPPPTRPETAKPEPRPEQPFVVKTPPPPVRPSEVPVREIRKPELKPEALAAQGLEGQKGLGDTTRTNLVIRMPEDGRARAIREAYEEQLGWSNVATGTADRFPHKAFSGPTFDDWGGYLALPTEGGVVPDIFTMTTNVTVPGAPITDALSVSGYAQGFWKENGEAARIHDLQRALDAANTLSTKYEADMQVFVRQQEVQLAEFQELVARVEETRSKLAKSLNEKSIAPDPASRLRLSQRLEAEMAQLEKKQIELSVRSSEELRELPSERKPKGIAAMDEEEITLPKANSMAQAGANVNVAPKKALEAKVTAVANELGLLVFSIGKDDGVLEGDEFTVYRGGDFVARVVVDRADRKWSAGKIVLKKSDPRVTDDVSNHIFVAGPRMGGKDTLACGIPTVSFDVVSAGEDGVVRLSSKTSTAAPQQVLAVTRAGKFVAMIRVDRVANGQIEAQVVQSLAVGRILPGDSAVTVVDPKGYLAALPLEVRMDLASRASQRAIRAKMGLKQ